MLAGGVVQINLVVGTQVASYFDGAVAWLSYADRLYQLPLGVVGVAIGVVLLPELSRRFRAGDMAGTREAMNRAAEFTLVLTLPAADRAGRHPRADLPRALPARRLRRRWTPQQTALALAVYAAGLPAFVMQKVLQPAFFAREDTRDAAALCRASRCCVNVGVAVGLAPVVGFVAAALGTTLAGWLNAALLWRGVRRLDGAIDADARLRRRMPRICRRGGPDGRAGARRSPRRPSAGTPICPSWRWPRSSSSAMAAYALLSLALGAFAVATSAPPLRRKPELTPMLRLVLSPSIAPRARPRGLHGRAPAAGGPTADRGETADPRL